MSDTNRMGRLESVLRAGHFALTAETTQVVAEFLRANRDARDTTAADLQALGLSFAGTHEASGPPSVQAASDRGLPGQPIAPGTGSIGRSAGDDGSGTGTAGTGGLDGFYYAALEKMKDNV